MEDLVKRAKEGDISAISEIIEKYKYFIMKQASKYHIPSYEYEDLVQHGYLSVIMGIHMYKYGSSSFEGYIINTIINNYKALLKGKIKHLREVPNNEILDAQSSNYELTIEDQIIAYDEIKKLYVALDKLSKDERYIIESFYILNKSIREIACDLDVSYYKLVRKKEKALMNLRKNI